MRLRELTFLSAFLIAGAAGRAAERDVVRTFAVSPGCTVTVDSYRGPITIQEGDGNAVRVAVHLAIGADDDAEAERMLQTLQLEMTASGNGVSIRARRPAETRARFVWNEDKQIEPAYRITVPHHCSLDLRTRQGSILVGPVEGAVTAQTEAGDVFIRHVIGPAQVFTASGDVVVSRCEGTLNARVALGTLRVGTVTGTADLTNASGDVEVMVAKADLRVYAEAGAATVAFARNYGGHAEVRTSGGPIIAKLDPRANCDLEASTSLFAHVDCRLPLVVAVGRTGGRKLAGKLNQGGGKIELRASGGNVRIEPGEIPFE